MDGLGFVSHQIIDTKLRINPISPHLKRGLKRRRSHVALDDLDAFVFLAAIQQQVKRQTGAA